jgi:hypothetical protein
MKGPKRAGTSGSKYRWQKPGMLAAGIGCNMGRTQAENSYEVCPPICRETTGDGSEHWNEKHRKVMVANCSADRVRLDHPGEGCRDHEAAESSGGVSEYCNGKHKTAINVSCSVGLSPSDQLCEMRQSEVLGSIALAVSTVLPLELRSFSQSALPLTRRRLVAGMSVGPSASLSMRLRALWRSRESEMLVGWC